MESNHPQDVPMNKFATCILYINDKDNPIFKGFNYTIEQKREDGRFRTMVDTLITLEGTPTCDNWSTHNRVYFYFRFKRSDVIEILKYGQFITMSGNGLLTDWEVRHEYEFVDTSSDSLLIDRSQYRVVPITKVVISVVGELNIK